jgi:hypothetical protein
VGIWNGGVVKGLSIFGRAQLDHKLSGFTDPFVSTASRQKQPAPSFSAVGVTGQNFRRKNNR